MGQGGFVEFLSALATLFFQCVGMCEGNEDPCCSTTRVCLRKREVKKVKRKTKRRQGLE
jgi:hypothetical protein